MLYGDYAERICQYILCCICQRPIYVHIQTVMEKNIYLVTFLVIPKTGVSL